MSLFGVLCLLSLASTAFAGSDCSDWRQSKRIAIRGALAVHRASGAEKPLTWEAHSLSSKIDSFGVILSYSGVQVTYVVTVRPSDCRITALKLVEAEY